MPERARRHHFIPAFLLAAFTRSGKKDGELWVTDFKAGKQFRQKPTTTGFQTDFHTIEVEGVAPDYLETELAKVEDRWAHILRDVTANRTMPKGEEFKDLMAFLALMYLRTPKARKVAEYGVDFLQKTMLRGTLGSKERWTKVQADLGWGETESASYEDTRAILNRGGFTFKPDQNWTLGTTMALAESVLPFFLNRKWSLLYSRVGGFICTDHPVAVSFTGPVPAMWTPAPGLPCTEVQCPLGRDLLIVGSIDGPAVTLQLDHKWLAYYNSRALRQADRFVYSEDKDFHWYGRDQQIKTRPDELFAAHEERSVMPSERELR